MPGRGTKFYQEESVSDDLPAPLTTRNLLPRSRATSLSRSEALSAVPSRSHSPSPSFPRQPYFSTYHSMQPPEMDVEPHLRSFSGISMDHSAGWGAEFNDMAFMTDSITMNHHIGSSYTGFENNDALTQPRRSRKKELFADPHPMPAGPSRAGPSSQPFYNEGQSSQPDSVYGLELRTMSGLKRKREESPEPLWLDNQNPPNPMSIPMENDDPSPYTISRDRKGKGKEIDYKGKGKQRDPNPEDSPILISDSPIINNAKPLPTATHAPSKPLSEPLSSYTCPICFSAPTNATLTPCGHICCGECLFTAVKTVILRSQQAGAPDAQEARCPVCRALIPDWDGKGAGVIGLKAKAIFSL